MPITRIVVMHDNGQKRDQIEHAGLHAAESMDRFHAVSRGAMVVSSSHSPQVFTSDRYSTQSLPAWAPRRRDQSRRDANPEILQKAEKVAAPAGGDRGGSEGIFQNQIPADDPGKQLSQGGVAVGVGRTGNRNQRGKLRVAQGRQKRSQIPDKTKESTMAGPAYFAAADPVSTKIPAPMIAPIPRVIRLTGPRARLRLCSPVSDASSISMSSGLHFKTISHSVCGPPSVRDA